MEPTFIADILFFAALAGFILYRLYSVLGQKDGTEENITHRVKEMWEAKAKAAEERTQKKGKVEIFPPVAKPKAAGRSKKGATGPVIDVVEEVTPLEGVLAEIARRDRQFTPQTFLHGASIAFEMILKAYAEGDRDTLKSLLDSGLFREFEQGIAAREKAGQTLEHTLVSVTPEIAEARLDKNLATIVVLFTSEQISCLKDKNGKTVEGDATAVEKLEDSWTFTRHLTSGNPNWTLVDTSE